MELVLGAYAVAVSTVILPLMSRQAALRQMDELKTTMNFRRAHHSVHPHCPPQSV